MSMGMGLGKVISGWAGFSKHLATAVRADPSLGPATWTPSRGSSWEKDKARKKAGQGVFLESTTPPLVADIYADSSEPQELWSLGTDLLVTSCCQKYSFPSDVLLETCLCFLPSAAAWHFIIFLMKGGFLCEKVVSIKLPFSAKGTDLSARVTNNVPFPDFLIKFFHWRLGYLLVISVEKWLCCFSLELHRIISGRK